MRMRHLQSLAKRFCLVERRRIARFSELDDAELIVERAAMINPIGFQYLRGKNHRSVRNYAADNARSALR